MKIEGVKHGIMTYRSSAPSIEGVQIEAAEGAIYAWPGSSPVIEGSRLLASEREGILAAPESRLTVTDSFIDGPLGGILWGSSDRPPQGLEGGRTVTSRVTPALSLDAHESRKAGSFPRAMKLTVKPDRVFEGESFIGSDQSWEGNVLIDGTVMVAPGTLLTIRPGTSVFFAWRDSDGNGIGESELFVQGRIVAIGEADKPILFASADGEGPGRWGAVNIMGSDVEENIFRYILVKDSYRGLHSHFSSFRVENSTFQGNYRGLQFQESKAFISSARIVGNTSGLRFRDSIVVIEHARVLNNGTGLQTLRSRLSVTSSLFSDNVLAGLHLRETEGDVSSNRITSNSPGMRASGGRLRVENNIFSGNSYGGLQVRGSEAIFTKNRIVGNIGNGFFSDSPSITMRENIFFGNLRFAVENNSPSAVDAVGNYWGSGAASLEDRIYDGADDPAVGPVLTDPPLKDPPPGL